MVTFEQIKQDEEVKILIRNAQRQLDELGYTEHSTRHTSIVANLASTILADLGYTEREVELAKIAGYLHDIGNSINRVDHAHTGAMLAYQLLKDRGMDVDEAAEIMLAIGNHDELSGTAVSPISAAIILADKSDVHRSRVRNTNQATFDIHDRVNYAVEEAALSVDKINRIITLSLKIDTNICPVIKYFEIFLQRMLMNKRAANYLKCRFKLEINGNSLLE